MSDDPTRIVLIDDHPVVRRGLRLFLATASDIVVVGEAATCVEGIALVTACEPHVALVDLALPDGDGIALTRQIATCAPQTVILVLTNYGDAVRVAAALDAGARAVLLKHVKPADLQQAIRAARRGEPYIPEDATPRRTERPEASRGGLERLSDREREVLVGLARGWSSAQLAAHLVVEEGTIRTHISNLLAKLGLENRTQAAILALRARLVALDEPVALDEGTS